MVGVFSLLFITQERLATIIGGVTAIILAVAALVVPIDQALGFGSFSLKIASSFQILGRNLTLDSSQAPLLGDLVWSCCVMVFRGRICRRCAPPYILGIDHYQLIGCLHRRPAVSLCGFVD